MATISHRGFEMQLVNQKHPSQIVIIYDGDCPFCSKYSSYINLSRSFEEIRLKNARDLNAKEIQELQELGLDINQGIIVQIQGNKNNALNYSGRDAMNYLAKYDQNSKFTGKLHRVMRYEKLSRFIYPILFWGRAVVLKILGIERIIAVKNFPPSKSGQI